MGIPRNRRLGKGRTNGRCDPVGCESRSLTNQVTIVTHSLFDVIVVMPVYNEADCIVSVVRSWLSVLEKERLNFQLLVLNDGSTDATGGVLAQFSTDSRVQVINKHNSGHGPTILMGYRWAGERASWVFQVDSDDEIAAEEFVVLWRRRHEQD